MACKESAEFPIGRRSLLELLPSPYRPFASPERDDRHVPTTEPEGILQQIRAFDGVCNGSYSHGVEFPSRPPPSKPAMQAARPGYRRGGGIFPEDASSIRSCQFATCSAGRGPRPLPTSPSNREPGLPARGTDTG